MPQPPPPKWKRALFSAMAHVEHALRGRSSPTPAELKKVRNFLVLQQEAALGSVVHATPFFEALKRTLPDAHITIAASSMAASVLGNNPFIDRCVVTPHPSINFSKTVHAVRELLRTLPAGPRCNVTTIGNRSPRMAALSMLSGDGIRIGHTAAPELYDLPLIFAPQRGQIEGNLDIVRALGHDVSFCEPRVFFTTQDVHTADGWLERLTDRPETTRVAFVTENSGGQRTRWSAERFHQVIETLASQLRATPIFVGTAQDAAAIESLRQTLQDPGISLAGKTTLPQLAAVLAQCDLAVSLDTGPFHVARAVGLPGVVIAPAWQNPMEWLPVDHPRYRVLRGPSIPAQPSDYWMEEISAEQVIAAALELLHAFPPSIEMRNTRRSVLVRETPF